MSTYVMFGKYSLDAVKAMSPQRTEEAIKVIKKHGGRLKAGYALLGQVDLILVLELPDTEKAMQLSADLAKLLGILFTTAPAMTVEEFDKFMT